MRVNRNSSFGAAPGWRLGHFHRPMDGMDLPFQGPLGERVSCRRYSDGLAPRAGGPGSGPPAKAAAALANQILRDRLKKDAGFQTWPQFLLADQGIDKEHFLKTFKAGLGSLLMITARGGAVSFGGRTYGPGEMDREKIENLFDHLGQLPNKEQLSGLHKWLIWQILPLALKDAVHENTKTVDLDWILEQSVRLFDKQAKGQVLDDEDITKAWMRFYFEEFGEGLRSFEEQRKYIGLALGEISQGVKRAQFRKGLVSKLVEAGSEKEVIGIVEKYLKNYLAVPSAKFYLLYPPEEGSRDELLDYQVSVMISYGYPGAENAGQKGPLDGEKWLAIRLAQGRLRPEQAAGIGVETITAGAYRFFDRGRHLAEGSFVFDPQNGQDERARRRNYARQCLDAKDCLDLAGGAYVDPVKYRIDRAVAEKNGADPGLIDELFYVVSKNCLLLVRPTWKRGSQGLFQGQTIYEIRETFEELLGVLEVADLKIGRFRYTASQEKRFRDKMIGPIETMNGLRSRKNAAGEDPLAIIALLAAAQEEQLAQMNVYKLAAWPNSAPQPSDASQQVQTVLGSWSANLAPDWQVDCQDLEQLGQITFDQKDFQGIIRIILTVIKNGGQAEGADRQIMISGRSGPEGKSLVFSYKGRDRFETDLSSFAGTSLLTLKEVKKALEDNGGRLTQEAGPDGTYRIAATFSE